MAERFGMTVGTAFVRHSLQYLNPSVQYFKGSLTCHPSRNISLVRLTRWDSCFLKNSITERKCFFRPDNCCFKMHLALGTWKVNQVLKKNEVYYSCKILWYRTLVFNILLGQTAVMAKVHLTAFFYIVDSTYIIKPYILTFVFRV